MSGAGQLILNGGGQTPFRPAAPGPAQCFAWPEDFGQRYTIFVDTEEQFDWSGPFDRGNRAVTAAAAIPDAARRFADLGAALTFLVDHPIATDPVATAPILRALEGGISAVGAQLHPWVNPPFDELVCPINSFAGNLPLDLEAAKLAVLTAAITDAFGAAPRIYRAGRYGLGPNTLNLIADHGYLLDSSMRSRYDYARQGGPDYSAIGNDPFVVTDGRLVELPLTTVYTGRLRTLGPRLHRLPYMTAALAKTRLLGRVALTPEDMPLADALEAVRVIVGEGLGLLNFSFHSPSLAPGHTPYVRSEADLATFWRWWDAVLGLLDRRGVRSASARQVLAALPCVRPDASVSTAGAGGL